MVNKDILKMQYLTGEHIMNPWDYIALQNQLIEWGEIPYELTEEEEVALTKHLRGDLNE